MYRGHVGRDGRNDINDVDILLVIHPKNLSEKTRCAIDQFVLKGGRAVIALDPYSVVDRPDGLAMAQYGMEHQAASAMPDLLRAWGLSMPEYTFAGDRMLAGVGSTSPDQRPETILPYMKLTADLDCFNKEIPTSAGLAEVTFWFPGVLSKTTETENLPADMEYTPLMMTTPQGNTWSHFQPL